MTQYFLRAEAGGFSIVGQPIGFVVEGDPNDPSGRSVVANTISGGRSESRIDSEGAVVADLSGPLDVGRRNEWHVIKVLVQALSRDGTECLESDDASDHRGEDGAIYVNGERTPVQVVSVPSDDQVWHRLARKKATTVQVNMGEVVDMVRTSLEKKRPRTRRDTILALDASHIGAAIGPQLVEEYWARYSDPSSEFGWASVWLLGPTVGSSRRLSGADV